MAKKFIKRPKSFVGVPSKHFAANGRSTTACGKRIPGGRNRLSNVAFSSDQLNAKCKKCQSMLVLASSCDLIALVACSEDGRGAEAMADARAAFKLGCATAKALRQVGPGDWKVRVWENLGWHSEVVQGKMHVHPKVRSGQKRAEHSVCFDGRWVAHDRSPVKAVGMVLDAAREHLMRLGDMVLHPAFMKFGSPLARTVLTARFSDLVAWGMKS